MNIEINIRHLLTLKSMNRVTEMKMASGFGFEGRGGYGQEVQNGFLG